MPWPPANKVAGVTRGMTADLDWLWSWGNGQVINPKDNYYGALGNNSGNDAPAINNAIADAVAGPYPLFLPPGTYLLGAPLSVGGTLNFLGAGRESSILQLANGVNDSVIKFTQGSGAITGARFADFTVNGNGLNQSAGHGISAVGAVQSSFERIHCTSVWGFGLALQPIPGGAFGHHNRVVGCLFDGAVAAGNGGGVWTTSSDENFFWGCDFEYLGGTTAPSGGGSFPVMFYDQAGLQMIDHCCFVGARGNNLNVVGIRVTNANQTRITGCTFDGVGGDNVMLVGNDNVVVANEFTSVGDQGTVNTAAGVHTEFGALRNIIMGNNLSTSSTAGKTGWLIYEQQIGNSGSNVIEGNTLRVQGSVGTALLATAGIASITRGNIGYNPVGKLGPPAVPATTVALVNPYNVDCDVNITGGTVTVISIGGQATGQTSGKVFVPAGQSITLTYSVAPTWTWFGA